MTVWFEIVYTIGCITITVAVALAVYVVAEWLSIWLERRSE